MTGDQSRTVVGSSANDGKYLLSDAHFVIPERRSRKRRIAEPPGLAVASDPSPDAGEETHVGFRRDGRRSSGVWLVERCDFDVCPICLREGDLTDEHVPMRALGGKVMTRTCAECNNKLGSTSEATLAALVAGEVVIEASAKSVTDFQGKRRATAAIRQRPFATPTLHMTSGDPDLLEALARRVPVDVHYRPVDILAAGVAILKYAYLASCVWFRSIPAGREADSIRAALVAARNGVRLPDGANERIRRLVLSVVLVENPTRDVGAIALAMPTGPGQPWTFILGQRLIVIWPFTDVLPVENHAPSEPNCQDTSGAG